MAKYDPLKHYLRRQRVDVVELSFVEIERKLGYMLPNRAERPLWWTADAKVVPVPPHQNAIHDAGFTAELMPCGSRVRFRRAARPKVSA